MKEQVDYSSNRNESNNDFFKLSLNNDIQPYMFESKYTEVYCAFEKSKRRQAESKCRSFQITQSQITEVSNKMRSYHNAS